MYVLAVIKCLQISAYGSLIDLEDIKSVKGVLSKSSENQTFVCRVKKKNACLDSYNTIHLKAKKKKKIKDIHMRFFIARFHFFGLLILICYIL